MVEVLARFGKQIVQKTCIQRTCVEIKDNKTWQQKNRGRSADKKITRFGKISFAEKIKENFCREDLRIKIVDFGSAVEEDGTLTRSLMSCLYEKYMTNISQIYHKYVTNI